MNKYAYLFQGKIRLLIPDENGRDNYVDLIDGSKLMLTSGRKYMYMREKKEDHFKKNGFKILEMHTTVRQQHYAGVASTFIKNFVSSMQKIIASDDITKDECEIIRDKVKALYGDNVSDKRTREDADKICREVIEKKERNKADIDKIKDRI